MMALSGLIIAKITNTVWENIKGHSLWKLFDKVYEKLSPTHETALRKVIDETMTEYAGLFPETNENDGQIPFYHSALLMSELLTYRIMHHEDYDLNKLDAALAASPNIIRPTKEELELLFEIFTEKVEASPDLKQLEIAKDYQNEIFVISRKVSALERNIESIYSSASFDLTGQWKDRIETYIKTLQDFKPATALILIDALLKSIDESINKPTNEIIAKIEFQRGICFRLLGNKEEAWKAFIKANKLSPVPVNKEQAALAYYRLGDAEKATALAEELLRDDEYNAVGWVIRMANCSADEFPQELKKVPQIVVKDLAFYMNLYNLIIGLGYHERLPVLFQGGYLPSYEDYSPKPFNINNITEAGFWANLLFVEFMRKNSIDFTKLDNTETADLVKVLNQLLASYFEKVNGTEIPLTDYGLQLLYAYTNYILTKKDSYAVEMYQWFHQLKQKTFPMVLLCANTLQVAGKDELAIALLEEYHQGTVEALTLLAHCYLKTKQFDKLIEIIKKINLQFTEVPHHYLRNMIDMLIQLKFFGGINHFQVSEFTDGKQFDEPADESLLRAIATILIEETDDIYADDLVKSASELNDPLSKSMIASALHLAGKHKASVEVFETVENIENRDLYFYIRAHFNANGDHKKLLELLKKWRLEEDFEPAFTKTEIQAYLDLKDWEQVITLSEYFLQHSPADEEIFMRLIYALNESGTAASKERLRFLASQIRDFPFTISGYASEAAAILRKHKLYKESLDLLYRYASDKENKQMRMAYFMAFTDMKPGDESLWPVEEYQDVEAGHFVKYKRNGQIVIVELNEHNLQNPFNQNFIGCNVNGAFTVRVPILNDEELISIERIMNKYLALHDEILEEARNNPFSGMPMVSIDIDPDNIVESLHQTLKKIAGEKGSIQRDFTKEEIEQYYSRKRSLSAIVARVFRLDYIGAYFDLTFNQDGIVTVPLPLISPVPGEKYIIDMSSLPMLYQIYHEHGIIYPEKFVISRHIVEMIKKRLEELEAKSGEQISVSVTKEDIRPSIISEDEHARNITYLKGLLEWIDNNCIIQITDRVLDMGKNIAVDATKKQFLDYFLNTSLLLEEQHDLKIITDDIFYYHLGVPGQKIVSTEYFVKKKLPVDAPALDEFIKNLYHGFSVSVSQLNKYYAEKAGERSNLYDHCLKNLSLSYSPNNIQTAIHHIKWLLMNAIADETKLRLDITAVLSALIKDHTLPGLYEKLRADITDGLKLLGLKQDIVLQCLDNAFLIKKSGQ